MDPQLTSGIVPKALDQSQDIEDILKKKSVVVQVLGTKVISSEDQKYRLCLSDGVHRTSTVLFRPTQDTGSQDPPSENSIVDIGFQRSYIQTLKGRTAWFIESYRLLSSPKDIIGAPVTYTASSSPSQGTPSSTPVSSTSFKRSAPLPPETPSKRPRTDNDDDHHHQNGDAAKRKLSFESISRSTHEIKSLNPYTNKYKILCRVISKGTLRKWSNSKGEGHVFNVTLQDASGEIQATGFNQTAERLFPLFEEGRAYYVSGAQIKPVRDRRYNSTNHNYEMGLTEHSLVVPADESSSSLHLPQLSLSLTKLSDIGGMSAQDTLDVMGVVVALGEAEEISVSKGARMVLKRDLTLRDSSGDGDGGSTMSVTLWDDKAKLSGVNVLVNKTIMVIRKAKISEWRGKSLSVGSGSSLLFDPDSREAHHLRSWLESLHRNPSQSTPIPLSQETNQKTNDRFACLSEIKEEFKNGVPDGSVGYYVLGTAYVSEIKRDKMMFKACENCSKKVSESNGGSSEDVTYVCKPCNTHSKNFNWRYVLNVGLADFSGHHWATIFDPVACKLLRDVPAGELHEAMNNDHKRFDQLLQSSKFCRWRLKVRAKVETWQKETRLKLIVIECDEVQQAPENERLSNEILSLQPEF